MLFLINIVLICERLKSTGTTGKSQSQANNPQKGREENILNEQDQTNPCQSPGKNVWSEQVYRRLSSEKDMNRGQQNDTNWGQQGNTSRDEGATGSGGQQGIKVAGNRVVQAAVQQSGMNRESEGGSGRQSSSGSATKNQGADYDDKEKKTPGTNR